jgi:hypothetical protein
MSKSFQTGKTMLRQEGQKSNPDNDGMAWAGIRSDWPVALVTQRGHKSHASTVMFHTGAGSDSECQ